MKNIVKISEYTYGRVNPRLRNIAKWINGHQKSIATKIHKENWDMFDYPDYWGTPKQLTKNLDTDELDFLQDQTYNFWKKNIKQKMLFIK